MKYLICNLKANKTKDEMIDYEKELSSIKVSSDIELVICPSTPFLWLFQNENYKIGSQDISKFDSGSYTGEITAEQLSSLNVQYALIGHSERRTYLYEDESTIIEKIKKSYHNHIQPIYFIGETKEEKIASLTKEVLENKITHIMNEVPEYKREKMLIVYEPIWAIGTGETPSIKDISKSIFYIKEIIKKKYNLTLPVLYGGSVNDNNIIELSSLKEIDGLVLGESAKNSQSIKEIYNIYQKNI